VQDENACRYDQEKANTDVVFARHFKLLFD
jgi:hypothetical protein